MSDRGAGALLAERLARIIRKRCFLSLVGDRSAITEWWVARFGEVETQGPLSPVA